MRDVADLLVQLGLERYIDAFAAAAVDLDTVRLLTDDDLKELGLLLGHRRKLLAAVARDGMQAVSAVPAPEGAPVRDGAKPERRYMTVLFCDLVGSTELTRRLEPDDMGCITRIYHEAVVRSVRAFDGFIDRFLGDGVLAFFGYPQARENAAESAVYAALEIVRAAGEIPTPTGEQLAVRIAVASGLVFISQTTGISGARERVVVGEVVNLAARLQEIAPANGVVVSPETRSLLRGAFELADLGTRELKGTGDPVRVWRVMRERLGGTRFQVAQPPSDALPPIIGRDAELALLASRWEATCRGEGQLVLVTGDAGIGKSRLCQALYERVRGEQHYVCRYQCSPFHTHSALYPVIAQLRRAARIEPDLTAEDKLARLESLLALSSSDLSRDVPIFAALLSIPLGSRYEPLRLSPEEQKRRTLEALVEQMLGLARRRPVLVLVEDAHWIDPTLSDALAFAIERAQDAPVLAVVTFRTGFHPAWSTLPNATTLSLSPLLRREVCSLISSVAGGQVLPAEVLEQIVAKTDGVPLFVEELTKTVLEQGNAPSQGVVRGVRSPASAPVIPASLHDSLLARIDRSQPAKEVAQVGSVLGREFSREHLAALSDLPDDVLQDAIDQLLQAGLIFQRGLQRTSYLFKHALVQDTAYGTLTLEQRQQLHVRCAEVLLRLSPDVADVQPELLAHHYAEGGDVLHAAEYWLLAGRRAVERSANVEAIAHLTRGLRMLDSEYWLTAGRRALERSANVEAIAHFTSGLRVLDGVQDARRRAELETALQIELGVPLIATRGYGARETMQAWERAHALAEERGERRQLVRAVYGLYGVRISLGQTREALSLCERVIQIGSELGDDGIELVGLRIRGVVRLFMGQLEPATVDLERALQIYDPARHHTLAYQFGQDQRVAALTFLSAAQWLKGDSDGAGRTTQMALQEAERLHHANTQAYALAYGVCAVAWMRRDVEELERETDRLLAFSAHHHLSYWQSYGMAYKGWAICQRRGAAGRAGLDLLRGAQDRFRLAADGFCDPMYLGMFAEALGTAGLVEEAMVRIDEAVAEAEARSIVWCLPELLRLKSHLLQLRSHGPHSLSDAAFTLHAALREARTRRLPAWEQRIEADLEAVSSP